MSNAANVMADRVTSLLAQNGLDVDQLEDAASRDDLEAAVLLVEADKLAQGWVNTWGHALADYRATHMEALLAALLGKSELDYAVVAAEAAGSDCHASALLLAAREVIAGIDDGTYDWAIQEYADSH